MNGISSLLGKSAGTGLVGLLLSVSSFPFRCRQNPATAPQRR